MVIQPQFDSTWGFGEGLAPVQVGGKWGYIDRQGHMAVPARYDWTVGFRQGLAVQKDNHWGFIDPAGKVVVPLQFDYALSFGDGLAPARVKGLSIGFIDRTGNFIIPPPLPTPSPSPKGWRRSNQRQMGLYRQDRQDSYSAAVRHGRRWRPGETAPGPLPRRSGPGGSPQLLWLP